MNGSLWLLYPDYVIDAFHESLQGRECLLSKLIFPSDFYCRNGVAFHSAVNELYSQVRKPRGKKEREKRETLSIP